MEDFEDLVRTEVGILQDITEGTLRGIAEQRTVNMALITNFVSTEEDVFSDPQTPQQSTLIGEINTLLDNFLQSTQELVTDTEENLNDIFAP